MLRGADISFEYADKLIVILPFTSSIGAVKFTDKIKKELSVNCEIFDLAKIDLKNILKVLNSGTYRI
jgi:uncharacterized protein (DUF2344 family)